MATHSNPFTAEQEQQIQQAYASLDERLGVTELDVAAGHQALMAQISKIAPQRAQPRKAESSEADWLSRWNPWALLGAGATAGIALMLGLNIGLINPEDGSTLTVASPNSLDAAQQLADAQGGILKNGAGSLGTNESRAVAAGGASATLASGSNGGGQLTQVLVVKGSPLNMMELVRRANNARLALMITHTPGGNTSVMVMNLKAGEASHRPIKRIAGIAMDYSGSIEFVFLK